ncbi:MAG: hypothetical protein EOO15_23200 [Chitinophagaceae bacterium]|nr:MAG: hypothetical protein EOO15_23200 [Chitinophagaceae bacterium]
MLNCFSTRISRLKPGRRTTSLPKARCGARMAITCTATSRPTSFAVLTVPADDPYFYGAAAARYPIDLFFPIKLVPMGPNDIVVDRKGTVFFSDPPYGLKDQQLRPDLRQEEAAFYCWRDGELTAFCKEYRFPNGLCLSPNEQLLYVCSSKPFERRLLAYDAATLELQRVVAEENCDGIKCDSSGRLWLCTREGIIILNEDGQRLARIVLEKEPANCCWGGPDRNHLFVTAREHVYCLSGLFR